MNSTLISQGGGRLWRLYGLLACLSILAVSWWYNNYSQEPESDREKRTFIKYQSDPRRRNQSANAVKFFDVEHANETLIDEPPSRVNNQTDGDEKLVAQSPNQTHNTEMVSMDEHCPSLYKVGTGMSEHSPVVFARDNLLLCRTPKVASTLLRSIAWAYVGNSTSLPKQVRPFGKGPTLEKVENETDFTRYLYGNDWRRVLFVRHPVPRILSGFLQVASTQPDKLWKKIYAFNQSYGFSPDAFELWLRNSTFQQEYDPNCGAESTQWSLDPHRQHWTPAQHCRCGLVECGVHWTIYRVEDHLPSKVMAEYIPSMSWLASSGKQYNSAKYNSSEYLTKDVLELLNALTKKEQEFFGYQPYTFI